MVGASISTLGVFAASCFEVVSLRHPMGVTEVVTFVISWRNRIALYRAGKTGRHHLTDVRLVRAVTPDCEEATALDMADEPFVSISASPVLNPCQREGLAHYPRNSISRLITMAWNR
jgi:hypothetical protein